MVTGNRDMANLLNKCCGDAFTREGATDIPEPAPMEIGSMMEEVSIKVRDLKKKIRALRSDAAAGPDGIGPRVLQALQDELAPVLAHIFKKTLAEGAVPEDWKLANVTPIFNPLVTRKAFSDRFRSNFQGIFKANHQEFHFLNFFKFNIFNVIKFY